MTGIYEDDAPDGPRSGQPAGVLSTWIDEQLRDIQGNQVPRFGELRARLQSNAFEWDNALLCRAIQVFCEEANKLDFGLLHQPRGWRKIFHRGVQPGRPVFMAQYERVVTAARHLQEITEELAANYRTHTAGARRVLVELEMEQQSMLREVNQAVEWMVEITEDLERRMATGGEDDMLALLRKRTEFHAGHLKALHGAQDMAAAICVLGQNVLERRTALLEQVKVDLDGFQKVWMRRVEPLAQAPGSNSAGLEKAEAAHAELTSRLVNTVAASEALQLEEHAIGLRLAAMRESLDSLN